MGPPPVTQFVSYGDFGSGTIDPKKCLARSIEGAFRAPAAEVTHLIEGGELVCRSARTGTAVNMRTSATIASMGGA